MTIELPNILNCPPKLLPVITDINRYRSVLLTGGRGGGKTETIARNCLYWGEQKSLKICCGRETQKTIEESVHSTLSRLITQYKLNYTVYKTYIVHNVTGSKFIFMGFKEQGRSNIKGLDDIDILWIDEAEAITKDTLDIIVPTIRKNNSKIIFTMNRKTRHDAVWKRYVNDPDCLRIHINYNENPFCPQILIDEALKDLARDEDEYNHIWLGLPKSQTDDYLFDTKKLDEMLTNKPYGDVLKHQRVIGFDFAAQGGDLCSACIMDRKSPYHWEIINVITWSDPDPDISKGKIISIIAEYQPDLSVMDIGGSGYVVFASLSKTGLPIYSFNGGEKARDNYTFANTRAEGYYLLKEWVDSKYLILNPKFSVLIEQMENIKFRNHKTTGRRLIQPKEEMKKDGMKSPDETDSLMMATYGAVHYLGKTKESDIMEKSTIKRVSARRLR